MNAIDTNVLVRYLTGDHPEQSARARNLIDTSDVFVPVTVILETEWVLRSAYGFDGPSVTNALRAFGGLPSVTIEKPAMVAEALDHAEAGMDFADALHLGASAHCDSIATFDRRFAGSAKAVGAGQVDLL